MFDSLNPLGLPLKYAVLYSIATLVFCGVYDLFGPGFKSPVIYLVALAMAGSYGFAKGYMRKKRGFSS